MCDIQCQLLMILRSFHETSIYYGSSPIFHRKHYNPKWKPLQQLKYTKKPSMQRPPRLLKSSQAFQSATLRKALTPSCLVQSLESCIGSEQIRSMRDSAHENPQLENVEYLEINKAGATGAVRGQCRSFKIRSYGHVKGRVKEGTITAKARNLLDIANINGGQTCRLGEVGEAKGCGSGYSLQMRSYDSSMALNSIGTGVGYESISCRNATDKMNRSSKMWVLILSQGLFGGSFSEEPTVQKLRMFLEAFHVRNPQARTVLRLNDQRCLDDAIKALKQSQVILDYAIWSQNRYYQPINVQEITKICEDNTIDRIVVLEDQDQSAINLYYQNIYLGQQNAERSEQMSRKVYMNLQAKYLYLKVHSYSHLIKFAQSCQMDHNNDHFYMQKQVGVDETEKTVDMGQAKQLIRLAQFRKKLKSHKKQERKVYSSKDIRKSLDSVPLSRKQSRCEKDIDQFKNKILQYAKILQQQQKQSRKIVERKLSTAEAPRTEILKFIPYKPEPNQSKTTYQLVNELIKNNLLISKQINKYREKVQAVNLQQIFNDIL